jgi:hypothetical protein
LRARRIPGEPRRFRTSAQVRACLGDDCKTVGSAYVGSNPTPATTQNRWSEPVSASSRRPERERSATPSAFAVRPDSCRSARWAVASAGRDGGATANTRRSFRPSACPARRVVRQTRFPGWRCGSGFTASCKGRHMARGPPCRSATTAVPASPFCRPTMGGVPGSAIKPGEGCYRWWLLGGRQRDALRADRRLFAYTPMCPVADRAAQNSQLCAARGRLWHAPDAAQIEGGVAHVSDGAGAISAGVPLGRRAEVAFEDCLGDRGAVPEGEELVGDCDDRERVGGAVHLDGGR